MNSSKFILDVNETTFQWSTNVSNEDAFILLMIEIRVSGTQIKIYLSKIYVLFCFKKKKNIVQKLIFKFKIYGAKLIDKFYKSPKINLVLILFGSSVLECCLDVHRKMYV